MKLRLSLLAKSPTNAEFELPMPGVEGYIIGRSDSQDGPLPDVDLSVHDAREFGVSRRHAAIVNYDGIAHVIDLRSINGTYVNDRRLNPGKPAPVSDGDRVTLGSMAFRIELFDEQL